jgi:hypothetical protein
MQNRVLYDNQSILESSHRWTTVFQCLGVDRAILVSLLALHELERAF